jgi:hypothetical protein
MPLNAGISQTRMWYPDLPLPATVQRTSGELPMAPPHPAPPHPPPPPAGHEDTESPAAEPPTAEPPPAPVPVGPKAKPRRPAEAAIQQRAVAALSLALLSLFGLLFGLLGLSNFQRGIPIAAFALLAGALAIWLAATSISRARRGGTMSPRGPVAAIVIGAIGVLLSGILLIGLVAFGPQTATYSRCLSGANTIAAQQACQNQFTHAIKVRASGG